MNVAETSRVKFGSKLIEYGIRRSSKRQTIGVAVDPTHGVLLTAPVSLSVERLDKMVHQKAPWILNKLRLIANVEARHPREFVSGESYHYLGRQYQLKIVERSEPALAKLLGSHIEVPVSWHSLHLEKQTVVREQLIAWYRKQAKIKLEERTQKWHKRLGVDLPRVLIRNQQKRWASCDARGSLRFNWRIVQAPTSIIDYVVAHELVHLIYSDHSREYWSSLGRVMPDYESRRERLRRIGPTLVW